MTARRAKTALKALLVAALLASLVAPLPACDPSGASSPVAARARHELEAYANDSGEKYWRYLGFDQRVDWCACFASYVADAAGLVDAGCAPKSARVDDWVDFYRDNPEAGTLEDGGAYEPRAGDFAIWQRSSDPDASIESHIAVVESYDAERGRVNTIEGNCGDSLTRSSHAAGEGVSYYAHPRAQGDAAGLASCSPAASGGEEIPIPAGLGKVHSYMGWQLITAPSSAQYQFRAQAGQRFDEEGFGVVEGRYVVACTTTYGDVGDYVDFVMEDGTALECVIGDIKSQGDPGCNEWGHLDGACIVEFVVDERSWYSGGAGAHANPGTEACHPEWSRHIVKAVNLGSWFDGAPADGSGSEGAWLRSCSAAAGGGGEDYGSASAAQKAMADEATAGSKWGVASGWCEMWVDNAYERATGKPAARYACATESWWAFGVSESKAGIPVGAAVWGYATGNAWCDGGHEAGHVGIYVGDGKVVSNEAGSDAPTTRGLDDWIGVFGWKGWGWVNGDDLRQESERSTL